MSSLITDGPVTSWLTGMSMIDSTEYVFTCMLYALCLFLCASHFTKSVSWSISLSVCRFGLNQMPQSAGRTLRSLPMQWKLMEQLSFGGDLQKNSIFGNNSRCCLYKLIPNSWMYRYKNFVGDGCVAYVCVCFSDTTLDTLGRNYAQAYYDCLVRYPYLWGLPRPFSKCPAIIFMATAILLSLFLYIPTVSLRNNKQLHQVCDLVWRIRLCLTKQEANCENHSELL
jgi:hypothetical protein